MKSIPQFKLLLTAAVMSAGALATTDAHARFGYPDYIPSTLVNGNQCNTCHVPGEAKSMRNAFGNDVDANLAGGNPDWSAVYDLDSDNDGYTNGDELGDPMGNWSEGDANTTFLSAPGNAARTPCGNGQLDPKSGGVEACDGANLDGKTCADFGGTAQQQLS